MKELFFAVAIALKLLAVSCRKLAISKSVIYRLSGIYKPRVYNNQFRRYVSITPNDLKMTRDRLDCKKINRPGGRCERTGVPVPRERLAPSIVLFRGARYYSGVGGLRYARPGAMFDCPTSLIAVRQELS